MGLLSHSKGIWEAQLKPVLSSWAAPLQCLVWGVWVFWGGWEWGFFLFGGLLVWVCFFVWRDGVWFCLGFFYPCFKMYHFLGIYFLVCHFWHRQLQTEGSSFIAGSWSNFFTKFIMPSGRCIFHKWYVSSHGRVGSSAWFIIFWCDFWQPKFHTI